MCTHRTIHQSIELDEVSIHTRPMAYRFTHQSFELDECRSVSHHIIYSMLVEKLINKLTTS